MEPIEQQRALALLGDPTTPPEALAQIAGRYRESWPLVAQHPNAYPGLLDWMRQQGFVPAPVAPAPPQPSALAAAVPAVPATASGPVPATEPGASAVPKTQRRPLLIAAVATVVLALVAGVAAAVGGFLPGLNPFGGGQLTVTGTPPAASGSWASGTREVWRSTPIRQSAGSSTGKGPFSAGVGTVTAQGWALGDIPGDTAVVRTGLSPDDGTVLWSDHYYDDCANTPVNGLVPCVTLVPEGLKLELIDWSAGTATSTTVLNDLDLGLGSLLPGSGLLTWRGLC